MKENIPGYPGYHVTRDGKVYSCLIRGGSSKRGPWKLKSSVITKTGHEQVILRTPKGSHSKGIHKLVALAYIPNPNNYPIVRHLDDVGTNNHVSNLKWGTQKDNVRDSIINGKHINPPYGSGLNSPRSLLKQHFRKQRRILRLFSLGITYKDIGKKVRISPKVVSRFIKLRNSLD
nr:MAG: zinc-binding loop region of homing endonuclease [Bacteriophage sp.]